MSKNIKIQTSESILLYFVFAILFLLANVLFASNIEVSQHIEILKYGVAFIFCSNIGLSLHSFKLKFHHPYIILLGTLGFFILSRIFLDIVYDDVNFAQTTFLSNYVFPDSIQIRLLQNLIISLISLQIGAGFAVLSCGNKIRNSTKLKSSTVWRTTGLFLFYLGLPFLLFQYIQIAREVLSRGYLILHDGSLQYSNSLIMVFMSRLSWVGFFVFLSSMPPKRQLYFNLLIFMLVLFPRLLQGARGPVMCIVLVLFWYVFYITSSKLKPSFFIILVSSLLALNIFIGSFRTGDTVNHQNHLAKRFIYGQGVSIQVLGYSIEHDDKLADYGIVNMFSRIRTFADIAKKKITHDPSVMSKVDIIEEFGYLGFWVTQIVNEDMLNKNFSIGGSYLGEFYLVGRELAQAIGSLLIGFLTIFIIEKLTFTRVGNLVLLLILPSWIYIPRDSTFNFITDNISNIIIAMMFIAVMMIITNSKNYIQRKIVVNDTED